MRAIAEDASPETVLSRLGTLSCRLKRRADTRPLAVPVDAARHALKALVDQHQERRYERMAASGARTFDDDQEDTIVSRVSKRLLAVLPGRQDATYKRMFKEAPSEATKGMADERQAQLVRHLIALISEEPPKDPAYAGLRDLLPELKQARAEVEKGHAEYTAAFEAESALWNEIQLAEQKAREVYRDTHPKLELMFPGRKKLVDSFFYQPPKKGAEEGR